MSEADLSPVLASDADRQRTSDLLGAAYVDGRLGLDEFHSRNDAVWDARTQADLARLIADLGDAGTHLPMPISDVPAPPVHHYILLSHRQVGDDWVVPAKMSSLICLGDDRVDMSQATFASQHVRYSLGVVLGSVRLVVPDGVTVIDHTAPILGSVHSHGLAPAKPGAPVIELTGFVCLGSVHIQGQGD